MFSSSFQSGFISIFYSVGSNPLALWDSKVKNGHIRRIIDDEVKSLVLEISGTNVATTFITSPIKPRGSLGIKLPFFVMVVKNMKKYFTFEIQILDDKDMRRRFRVSNFQSTTKVRPFCTTMPIGLNPGWNQVQFNLADFTKRAYGSTYIETMRVQIHANVRVRRLYFTDTLYSDEDMPNEFKLFGPPKKKEKEKVGKDKLAKGSVAKVEEIPPPPSPIEEEGIPVTPAAQEEGAQPPPAEGETPAEEKPPEEVAFEEGQEAEGGVRYVAEEEDMWGEEDFMEEGEEIYLIEGEGGEEEGFISEEMREGIEEEEGVEMTAEQETTEPPTEATDVPEGETPAEEQPPEEPPVGEEAPAEEAPAEVPPAEEPPAEEAVVEEAPTEEPTVTEEATTAEPTTAEATTAEPTDEPPTETEESPGEEE